jgi:acetylglutamate kinase
VLSGERIFLQKEDRRIDLGYVGRVTKVNGHLLKVLCDARSVPVIAPIAMDQSGGKLNVNADDVAGELAAAIGAEKLVVLSDTHGVRLKSDDPNSLASALNEAEIRDLISRGIIAGGMLPKVNACLRAIDGGVGKAHIIDGRLVHSLLLEIYTDKGVGTQITKNS